MASPLHGKIKNRRMQSSSTFLQEHVEDESEESPSQVTLNFGGASQSHSQSSGPLDISKIQNSNNVNSALTELLKQESVTHLTHNRKVNNQKEAVEKDVAEQHEKTKDFDLFQMRLGALMKQSQQKEKEFEDQIHNNASKISKYIQKKADLQTKLTNQNQAQRDFKEKTKEVQEQLQISKQQFDEQLAHKEDIFAKTLANKDKLLADIQSQISKTQSQYEKQKGFRIAAENDLKQKEQINIKMKDRIETQKKLLNDKRKDPAKQQLIEDLQRQNDLRRKGLDAKVSDIQDNKNDLMNLKEQKEELEQKRLALEHKKDDLTNDLEDKTYLEGRIMQVEKSAGELSDQKTKIQNKITKKNDKIGGASQSTDELQQIVDMILSLTSYERTCQVLDDQLRDIENRLHIVIEHNDFLSSQHLNNKDKLIHSLGKQKGSSSTGGLGFIIKHVMIEKKMDELKEELQRLRVLEEKQKKKLDEALMGIHSKNFEKVTKSELECVIIINEDVRQEVLKVIDGVTQAEKSFANIQAEYEKSSERLRLSYVTEVQERLKMGEDDNLEGIERTGKVIDSLRKFEQESEKQGRLMRSKEKKDEIKRLRDLAQSIRDDSNEIKANLNVRKNQIDKAKKSNKDVEKLSIGKLNVQIQDLKCLDNLTDHDKKDVNDIERRVGDLSILFRDFLKSLIKEIFHEMSSKMDQRTKSLLNLQKKDSFLLNQIELRRNELFGIQTQLEDDDLELQALYRKMEQTLDEANHNEDASSVFLRQLQSQTDRLQKQVQRITKDNFNQEEMNELLDQLDGMDQVIQQCDDKLEEGIKKATGLETSISEMELKIKIERIHECESEQRITSEAQEKLKRLIDRMQAQIFVIEKDQNYLLDEFSDMEKKKESLAFKQELDKKQREFGAFKVLRDKYKVQRDNQEQIYEDKQRKRDQISAQEFQRLRKESQKLREDIQKVVENVHGAYGDEISACKEVIGKMVKKYKGKKDKFQACVEAKMTRESEIVVWKDRLLGMRDRIQMIEGQLSILGVNEEQEGVEIYKKFLGDIERLRQNATAMDKATQKFQERIADESEDLDQMEVKIVKTAKLEDIEKALDQIGMQIEGYEKEVEKFDLIQKQIEKEVEAFMNKIRSSQLFDCEQRISEVEDTINKLIKKLSEVGGEVTEFKQELSMAQARDAPHNAAVSGKGGSSSSISKSGSGVAGIETNPQKALLNRDELTYKSEQFVDRVDQGGSQRTKISNQLEALKGKLDGLDKKTVSMNEIYAILSDAQTIGVQATTEIKKANDVQEELRQLNQEWKEKNKQQSERHAALQRAKELIKNNTELFQKMKVMLTSSSENVGQFDTLYKAMLGSDDYNPKRGVVEKKMRRMAQLKSECGRFSEDKAQIEQADNRLANIDLDAIEDVEKLMEIVRESEKIGNTLTHNVKELGDIGKGLEKKRVKVADAEVRSLALKRKSELASVAENLQQELKKMNEFEQALLQRQLETTGGEAMSPEKKDQIQRTLENLRTQFNTFKAEYDKVEDEIRNVSTDIECRDLEHKDPLSKLAKDIENLKKQNVEVKELKFDLEKIQAELKSKKQLLSSMDTEKKLKDLLLDIEKEMINMDGSKQKINKVVDIAKNYEGYTSGNEDEEFFQVVAVDGQDLNQDLLGANKTYADLLGEIKKLMVSVENKKQKAGGALSSEEIDDLSDQILTIESKHLRNKKTGQEICAMVEQSQEKVSQHGLENKVDRRGDELSELDKIIQDILIDNQNVKQKIEEEIKVSSENPFYEGYCKKLSDITTLCDNIEEACKQVMIKKEDISRDQKKTRKRITLQTDERLEIFYQNLNLKKQIQACLKNVGDIHSQVKQVFSKTNESFGSKPKEEVKVSAYKFDPSDEVDKMFAFYLNKLGLSLPVKRLGGGYYMFGTKKIFCKIINGKLVVRVGGGYMGMEEFCNQYGQQEQDKCRHLNDVQNEAAEQLKQQQESSTKSKDTSKKIVQGLNIQMASKTGAMKSNMESPKTGRSMGSDSFSVTSGGAGQSSFLNKALNKQINFAQATEEAKTMKDDEGMPVAGGSQTTVIKKAPTSISSVANSATSKHSTKVVKKNL